LSSDMLMAVELAPRKPKRSIRSFVYAVTGGLIGGAAFLPLTLMVGMGVVERIVRFLQLEACANMDDYMLAIICLPPVLVVSAITGWLAGSWGYGAPRFRLIASLFSAAAGGLLGSFLVSLALNVYIYADWIISRTYCYRG
jgi:hypothetical protein